MIVLALAAPAAAQDSPAATGETEATPAAGAASPQQTSPEDEEAGRSRGGYAWGEAPVEEAGASDAGTAYRRYGTAFAHLGFGGTIRINVDADVCNPDTNDACRFSPPYMLLRGGYMFETDSILQHGAGLSIGTNLSGDGDPEPAPGIYPFEQWTITPAYYLRVWFDDWVQLLAHFGIPLAIANVTGSSPYTAFNWGLELQANAVVKFLTGLGVYVGANISTWFADAINLPVWPMVSFEGGLVFDYEVLP